MGRPEEEELTRSMFLGMISRAHGLQIRTLSMVGWTRNRFAGHAVLEGFFGLDAGGVEVIPTQRLIDVSSFAKKKAFWGK
ncbi:uncharacterized protein N7482_002191 [Penicillium canariense]|uniref:Uncharacterized protein n=1 Tax=Penicillium canariense TaxID=189055 RepID=A0A9W9LUL0_9EURO|nr:uncharacterized protein N7482_002191 [Penicillium canariense]KAJ5176314.1 hypothetical protein N7482_002191 [Penicillium canariense]